MREYEVSAGEHIEKAIANMRMIAPSFMVFNGIRLSSDMSDSNEEIVNEYNHQTALRFAMNNYGSRVKRALEKYIGIAFADLTQLEKQIFVILTE